MQKITLNQKLNQLNRKMRTSDLSANLKEIGEQLPEKELQHLTTLAKEVKDSPLDGIPFLVASMKAKLKNDKEIAEILTTRTGTKVTVSAVQKYSQLPGFTNLVTSMMPGIWQDLILQAQGVISYHLQYGQDKELAKWLLESLGQVASSRPLTENKTLIVNGAMPGPMSQNANPGQPLQQPVEAVAMGLFKQLTENIKVSGPPPTVISE